MHLHACTSVALYLCGVTDCGTMPSEKKIIIYNACMYNESPSKNIGSSSLFMREGERERDACAYLRFRLANSYSQLLEENRSANSD